MPDNDKVFIYTLSTCGHCKRTKQFLDENNIGYDYVDVDQCQGQERQDMIEEVKKHNPRTTFPTIVIGDNVIVGFREQDIRDALGL
jgi:glutaredoxin-like protein NrdH